jgi:D-glycero-D-manno-heptose 1,7-bisphosphate phosphatase
MTTVFLDRDGVINEKLEAGKYVTAWQEFRFLPGSVEAIRLLNEAELRVMVITNQRGVALGLMSMEQLQVVHHHMLEELQAAGAHLDAIYCCPHAEDSCDCRKPGIGLFLQAKSDFPDIVFDEVYVIGDSDRDMEAGRRLGARLIRIGQPTAPDESGASSLLEAVKRDIICADPTPEP